MSTHKLGLPALTLASAILLTVTGCGGGNDGGDTPPPPSTELPVYLPFVQGFDANDDVSWGAIPAAGGTTSSYWEAGQGPTIEFLVQAKIDNGLASNVHRRGMLFVKNGQLIRRDLIGVNGLPAEVRVSTITTTDACDVDFDGPSSTFGADLADINRSWKIFRKRGVDGQCDTADDRFFAVRANMGPTEAPLEIMQPVATMHSAQGGLTGWLLRNGQQMQRVNADFTNPVTLFTLPADDLRFFDLTGMSNHWVFASGGKVYAVDLLATAPAALTVVTTLQPGDMLWMTSFANKNDVIVTVERFETSQWTSRLFRYATGTKAVNSIGQVSNLINLTVTPTRVITHSTLGSMQSLPLAGGAAQTLYTSAASTSAYYAGQHGGERVWQDARGSVISVNSDGTGRQTLQGAQLAGCIYKPLASIENLRRECDAVILIENNVARSYDAATGALRVTYGTMTAPGANLTGTFYFDTFTEWGQNGVLSHLLVDNTTQKQSIVNYLIKTDQPGVTPIVTP